MKNIILSTCMITAMFALSGNAQSLGGRQLTAEVPFDFHVGNATLAAGSYIVDIASPGVVRVATSDRKATAMLLINAAQRKGGHLDGKLVFNRYGNQYFLSSVWVPGLDRGIVAKPTAVEREMIARIGASETHAVAARRR